MTIALETRRQIISTKDEVQWDAVVARDRKYDGKFYYSVATTGVYCRPSCPSRLAKRVNVHFHDTRAEAEAAGFRPCKRCQPDRPALEEQHAAKIANACRLIEEAEEEPKLEELAQNAGLSAYHFHRIFKAVTGVTPKAYAIAHRQKRVRERLGTSKSVTEAIYDAGFNSSGRFYANSSRVLGMTPRAFRKGGASAEIRFAVGECSLGSILVAASDNGVCAISFGDDPDTLVRKAAQYPAASALQPGEIRRCLGGFRRGGENRFLVFLHDGKPGGEILRVIGAGLVGDLKIGTEEGGAQLGDKLLHPIGLITEAFSKLSVAAGLGRSPVREFMAKWWNNTARHSHS